MLPIEGRNATVLLQRTHGKERIGQLLTFAGKDTSKTKR